MQAQNQMKRAVVSEPADGRCLKRANSSLFSISTLVDDDPNSTETIAGIMGGGKSSTNLLLLDNEDIEEDEDASVAYSTLKRSSGLVPLDGSDDSAGPDDAVSSSCSSSELDEREDSEVGVGCKPIQDESFPNANASNAEIDQALPTSSSGMVAASQCLPCEPPTNAKLSGDNRTGLVFESGSKHFDRHNRFHKERPLRITSVHDYLTKSKPSDNEQTIFDRCHLLDSHGGMDGDAKKSSKSPEELWLEDHDYLRVHLPGYMQWYVMVPLHSFITLLIVHDQSLTETTCFSQRFLTASIEYQNATVTIALILKQNNSNRYTSPMILFVNPRLQPHLFAILSHVLRLAISTMDLLSFAHQVIMQSQD